MNVDNGQGETRDRAFALVTERECVYGNAEGTRESWISARKTNPVDEADKRRDTENCPCGMQGCLGLGDLLDQIHILEERRKL